MVYSCESPNKSEAQKEEYRIRKLTKKEKVELINKGNKERAQ
jgi:predicted GIY-YIG superfamily endonuclease